MSLSDSRLSFSTFILAAALLMSGAPKEITAQQVYSDLLRALTATTHLSGDTGPQNVVWIDGGERYSYFEHNPETGIREIRAYSPEDERDELIFSPADRTSPATDTPFGFESFEWSPDESSLLFRSNVIPVWRYSGIADYYLYDIEESELRRVADEAFTAELSPDGQWLGFGREGELYVRNLESGDVRQLTDDSEEYLYNGRFGWVYEEEFGRVQAWEWSPDSRAIAFWQSDERHIPLFKATDFEGQYPEYSEIPYPKAGTDNPTVRIGILDVESGDRQWLDPDIGDGYIPRIYWTAREDHLAVVELNRLQNHLRLHLFDTESGESSLLFEESADEGWIDIFNFFTGSDDHFFFPEDREEFFWLTDRDGYRHLYRYDYDGTLINRVTEGEWEITKVHSVDPGTERIWYESTEASPLERHLYSIGWDGDDSIRHTRAEGRHHFDVAPGGRWFISRYSNTSTPTRVELWSGEGGGMKVETLTENRQVEEFTERFAYSPREMFRFQNSEGDSLDGMMIRPVDKDPDGSYPVVLDIYGGPGAQGVFNEFETDGWRQYLAQHGFAVVDLNNRGSGGYGRSFEKQVYGRLGLLESEDYADLIGWLADQYDWIDKDRVAIRGHSYGGYLAALVPLLYPDLFQVSIAAAPVTDWRLYDTIYTERYMGLPDENEEGYRQSAVMTHADQLQANMLVVHSAMDENVHLQNSMQMIRAFTDHGHDVDLRIFPPGNHGIAYNRESYLLLYEIYTEYLKRQLRH